MEQRAPRDRRWWLGFDSGGTGTRSERPEAEFGVPVHCVNVGAAAALAEWCFGAARGPDDMVGLAHADPFVPQVLADVDRDAFRYPQDRAIAVVRAERSDHAGVLGAVARVTQSRPAPA